MHVGLVDVGEPKVRHVPIKLPIGTASGNDAQQDCLSQWARVVERRVGFRFLCFEKTPSLLHDKHLCRLRLGTLSS
jgi:hypothetical protein